MGLSAPRARSRLPADPNNTAWSRSTTRLGARLLAARGWRPGMGLGATPDNTSAPSAQGSRPHTKTGAKRKRGDGAGGGGRDYADEARAAAERAMRIVRKDDTLGVGARNGASRGGGGADERFGLAGLDAVLRGLSSGGGGGRAGAGGEREGNVGEKAEIRAAGKAHCEDDGAAHVDAAERERRARVWHRWGGVVFVRSAVLRGNEEIPPELAAAGPPSSSPSLAGESGAADGGSDTEARRARRAERRERRERRATRRERKAERARAREAMGAEGSSGALEEEEDQRVGEKKKKRKEKKEDEKEKQEQHEEPSEKPQKRKRKKQTAPNRDSAAAAAAEPAPEKRKADRRPAEDRTRNPDPAPAVELELERGREAVVEAEAKAEQAAVAAVAVRQHGTPLPRHLARARYIRSKRAAVADARALREIFMVKG